MCWTVHCIGENLVIVDVPICTVCKPEYDDICGWKERRPHCSDHRADTDGQDRDGAGQCYQGLVESKTLMERALLFVDRIDRICKLDIEYPDKDPPEASEQVSCLRHFLGTRTLLNES